MPRPCLGSCCRANLDATCSWVARRRAFLGKHMSDTRPRARLWIPPRFFPEADDEANSALCPFPPNKKFQCANASVRGKPRRGASAARNAAARKQHPGPVGVAKPPARQPSAHSVQTFPLRRPSIVVGAETPHLEARSPTPRLRNLNCPTQSCGETAAAQTAFDPRGAALTQAPTCPWELRPPGEPAVTERPVAARPEGPA